MHKRRLKLNDGKTQIMIFGRTNQSTELMILELVSWMVLVLFLQIL